MVLGACEQLCRPHVGLAIPNHTAQVLSPCPNQAALALVVGADREWEQRKENRDALALGTARLQDSSTAAVMLYSTSGTGRRMLAFGGRATCCTIAGLAHYPTRLSREAVQSISAAARHRQPAPTWLPRKVWAEPVASAHQRQAPPWAVTCAMPPALLEMAAAAAASPLQQR